MYDFDKKFENFSKIILSQAAEKRDEILADYEKTKISELKEYEDKCIENYQKQSESEIANAKKECSREFAKIVSESKNELFAYREELINLVFDKLNARFSKFKKGNEYIDFIEREIDAAQKEIGNGNLQITLDVSDESLIETIKKKYDANFLTESGILGGAVVVNVSTGMCYDGSVSKKISDLRENFLEKSGFSIF